MQKERLLEYLQQSVKSLVERGTFDNGWEFRKTQGEALTAYNNYLNNPDLPIEDKLQGFFEIPTGVGKTAIFTAITGKAQELARSSNEDLSVVIVAPTTNLVYQTREEYEKFVPSSKRKIGLYADGKKDLSHSTTIMTYDAWVKLTKEGVLSPETVDVLISDEAHRGTSEDRVDNVFSIYEGQIPMLAVTATARFDDTKSVEQTHKNQIYEKSLPQAIKDDELASYIQTQEYVIRVEPEEEDALREKFGDAVYESGGHKRLLRRAAWNKRVLQIFRDGRDERTKEPLTDNQAAFYVSDTAHADVLEKQLNSDLTLQQRAIAKGYKGVAVAIHSRMSKTEQRRREKEYKAGKYMAIIGDQKFKEGFNYPPMKTVIDYPHGSLVDKAQILGRGARKWFNESKKRWEGLTFIDTTIYMGDDDLEEDKKQRAAAIRGTVGARQILEGSYALSKRHEKLEKEHPPKASKRLRLFEDDPYVEEYTTLEDIATFASEQEELRRENHIEITDEILSRLLSEKERTGLGGASLLKDAYDIPEGLRSHMINDWLNGHAKTAHKDHVEYVFKRYAVADVFVEIAGDVLKKLHSERNRTKLSGAGLLRGDGNVPEGLTGQVINTWLNGGVQRGLRSLVNYTLEKYGQKETKLTLSEKMVSLLNQHQERTKLGGDKLYRLKKETAPKTLSSIMIKSYLSGNAQTILQSHWNWLVKTYEEIDETLDITDEMRNELLSLKGKKNIGSKSLLKESENSPKGLSFQMIESYFSGRISVVKKEYWDWLIQAYSSCEKSGIVITDAMREELRAYKERTGVSSTKLIAETKARKPKGLSVGVLDSYFRGDVGTAKEEYWNWVIEAYKKCPYIAVTDEMRAQFLAHRERTAIGPRTLLKTTKAKKPKGFNEKKLNAIFNATSVVIKEHWDWAIKAYEESPYIKLTPDISAKLSSYKEKTGVAEGRLLKISADPPKGLTQSMIGSYIKGVDTNYLRKDYLDWITNAYEECPYEQITDEMRLELLSLKEQAALGAKRLCSMYADTKPDDLTISKITSYFVGDTITAKTEHWEWIVSSYRSAIAEKNNNASPDELAM